MDLFIKAVSRLSVGDALSIYFGYFHILVRARGVSPKILNQRTILLRDNTFDYQVFAKIFVWESYANLLSGAERIIIDAGANIGCSTAYFAECATSARIVAIEPAADNFRQLLQNTSATSGRITYICKPLAGQIQKFNLDASAGRPDGYVFRQATDGDLESVTIDGILEGIDWRGDIDLVKVDIEGGEYDLFLARDISWISRCRYLVCEFHKDPRKDAAIERICAMGFECCQKGEDTHFVRKNPK